MKKHIAQGLWFPLIWFCLIRTGVPAQSDPLNKSSQHDSASTNPTLQVLIYNYTPLSNADLKVAKEVATGIFADVGVRVEWLDCYSAEGDLNYNPDCQRLTPTTLIVRILPRSKAEGLKQPPTAARICGVERFRPACALRQRLLPSSRAVKREMDLLSAGRARPRHGPRDGPSALGSEKPFAQRPHERQLGSSGVGACEPTGIDLYISAVEENPGTIPRTAQQR